MATYQETVDFLFSNLPMFQRVGAAAYKKDLANITSLCEMMGNPHTKFLSIHVAGTNGKGSTTHIIAAYLQAMGLQVGVFTSPHYKDFRERIKINGVLIEETEVVQFVERYRQTFDEIKPSFFEMGTAMAFWCFAKQKVDIAIIETGMGGRLDSTNIITPILSVITNISYDHTQFLGETLPLIAGEKAGIIKAGVPVVIGERQEETTEVFVNKASDMTSEIYFAQDIVSVIRKAGDFNKTIFDIYVNGERWLEDAALGLFGNYQEKNLVTALGALVKLSEISKSLIFGQSLSKQTLIYALANVRQLTGMMGRWEVLGEHPLVLADSAHNEAGIAKMFEQVKAIPHERLHIVYGMVNDKDIRKALTKFPPDAMYYFCKPDIPRGLDVGILLSHAHEMGYLGGGYDSVAQALEAAKAKALKNDLVLVAGSIFVVAEVL